MPELYSETKWGYFMAHGVYCREYFQRTFEPLGHRDYKSAD